MKKFYNLFSVFSCFLILIIVNSLIFDLFNLTNKFNVLDYKIYAYDEFDIPKTKCGNFFIYDKNDLENSEILVNKIGEEIILIGDKRLIENIVNDLNLEFVFCDENFECNLFFYSPKIKNFYYINNQKINVQIYLDNNQIKIGTPLIFGFM